MQEIKAICNRVMVINQGEIVADYTDLSKINAFDENSYMIEVEFLDEMEDIVLQSLPQTISIECIDSKLVRIASSNDIRAHVFDLAVANQNKILSLKKVERSMEEVFKMLTHK
jgi:ABC-2 type transport system ATP-binding protein